MTRADVREFLALAAAEAAIKPEYQEYGIEDANVALLRLKQEKSVEQKYSVYDSSIRSRAKGNKTPASNGRLYK